MKTIPVRQIKANHKAPNFSDSFNIRNISDMLAGTNMVQPLHRHDFFFMLVLKKAKGHHEIDFTPYKPGDNTIFFLRPGQVHQLTLKAGSTGYLMEFTKDFYYPHDKLSAQLLRKAASMNYYKPDATLVKKLDTVLTHIFQEYTGKQQMHQEAIKANLGIFFIELVRLHKQNAEHTNSLYTQERLEKLLALLETNITTHKQVSDYAHLLNLSPWQLNAITKAALGKTCSHLINEQIILESKRYLLATANQVSQIAYHLGYEDVSYFIRFFKKHTGYSPEAFRNNFQ
jgi:AraC family transcriptional regulator, transcriptional activator of pobA